MPGRSQTPFIVILNDNEMSIAPNVGSIASYLSVLRTKPFANFVRRTGKMVLKRIPLGGAAKRAIEGAEIGAMHFIGPSEKTAVIFEELGFRYIGPVDGHNYDVLVDALQTAKDFDRPVLLHVRTVKGKGYEPAERDSRTFHGIGANAFEPSDGSKKTHVGRPPEVPRRLRRRDDRGCREGSARRRHHRGDARRHRPGEVRQTLSRALFRRRHRRGARRLFCSGPGIERSAAGLRDLLDLLAAGLRSDRARRRRAESSGRLLHGSRRFRRRRRPDAHGALRHRLPAHAAELDADGAAQRSRAAADAGARS